MTYKTESGLKYEKTPEDKKRRKFLRNTDKGQVLKVDSRTRRFTRYVAVKLRQGYSVFVLAHGKVKEHSMIVGVLVFIASVWLSGFFAHAGLRFESLLSLVAGFIILAVIAYRESNNGGN